MTCTLLETNFPRCNSNSGFFSLSMVSALHTPRWGRFCVTLSRNMKMISGLRDHFDGVVACCNANRNNFGAVSVTFFKTNFFSDSSPHSLNTEPSLRATDVVELRTIFDNRSAENSVHRSRLRFAFWSRRHLHHLVLLNKLQVSGFVINLFPSNTLALRGQQSERTLRMSAQVSGCRAGDYSTQDARQRLPRLDMHSRLRESLQDVKPYGMCAKA